jgi:hypothetical protein
MRRLALPSLPAVAALAGLVLAVLALAACSTTDAGLIPAGADADVPPPSADAAPQPPDAAPPLPDAAGPDAGSTIADLCFPGLGDPTKPRPDYDSFHPTVGSHCAGTNHQAIAGVEKVVFLGDSITEGTPPTPIWDYYREVLAGRLRDAWGSDLEVTECAAWGARTDDLLLPPHQQVMECFAGPEPKKTLIVMTIGGNDMKAIVDESIAGDTMEQTLAKVDGAVALLRDAIVYVKDPVNFPAGSYVVFANNYEFTDGTGEFDSCPGAGLAGYGGVVSAARPAFVHAAEEYMRLAVETGTDMIFLLESFCGHGFHAGEADNECYRGAGAETWFDFTCIHPTPAGHEAIAGLFEDTILE